jgi:hypothetical protein
MVDSDDDVIEAKLQIGEQQIILGDRRQYFIFSYQVVAQIADGSTDKMRQVWRRLDPWAGK